MTTTVVRPVDKELRRAWRLGLGFAAVAVLFHVAMNLWQSATGWGYFRDEMYYLMCGRRLASGYVDHGPMVALQARVAETMFGRSLAGLRMFAGIAGGVRLLLTGLLAWSLGGRRAAQGLAMIGVFVAPQYLGGDGYLSMNSWESAFWMTCVLALVMMERGGGARWWLAFGVAAGLGLLNKPSMTFFLVALLVALLVTPQRRLLGTPWMLAGVGLMLLIVLPNLLWQVHNHWPTLEFLHNGRVENKNRVLGPLEFLVTQWTGLLPVTVLVWGAGLVWLLRRSAWRWLGVMFVVFLATMMALHAKDYYVMPVYPVLFAAGGVAWEGRLRAERRERLFGMPVLEAVLIVVGVVILPMSTPVLRPETWVRYATALHLRNASSNTENQATSDLPQFYADRFGWQEEVEQVTAAIAQLSPADRAKVGIFCGNYGEASAIDFLGRGLPRAISGQNNYWLWGPEGETGEVMITVSGASPEEVAKIYREVKIVGRMTTEHAMPYEHKNIYLVHGRKTPIAAAWADYKLYI